MYSQYCEFRLSHFFDLLQQLFDPYCETGFLPVLCPVCDPCHGLLNQNDKAGIVKFAHKIYKSFGELTQKVNAMIKNMNGREDEVKKKKEL